MQCDKLQDTAQDTPMPVLAWASPSSPAPLSHTSCRTTQNGDLGLALYGSFLPVPSVDLFPAQEEEQQTVGKVFPAAGEIVINEGRLTVSLSVTNVADRPIQASKIQPLHRQLPKAFLCPARPNVPATSC